MITTQAHLSHLPAADDVDLDSLEYLFGSGSKPKQKTIPWVEIISDSEKFDIIKEELQAKIDLLELRNDVTNSKLQRAMLFIGYLNGMVHERDQQLKVLPDLRFTAAQAITLRIENERSKEKIQELEEQLQRLSASKWKLDGILNLDSSESSDELAITILNLLGLAGLSTFLLSLIQYI